MFNSERLNSLGPDYHYVASMAPIGDYGMSALYKYEGDDPQILALCDSKGHVKVTLYALNDYKPKLKAKIEEVITRAVENAKKLSLENNSSMTSVMPIKEDGQPKKLSFEKGIDGKKVGHFYAIVSKPYVDYIHKKNGHDQFIYERNIAEFLPKIMLKNKKRKNKLSAFSVYFAETLNQFARGMMEGQNQLRQIGLLHGSTRPENFVIADPIYDAAKKPTYFPVLITNYDNMVLLSGEKLKENDPIIMDAPWYLNDSALKNNFITARTDSFAIRVAILCMLGHALGASPSAVLRLGENFESSFEQVLAIRSEAPYTDDKEVLKRYLLNIQLLSQQCSDPFAKEAVDRFIDSFKDFLVELPDVGLTAQVICAQDNEAFFKASAMLSIACQEKELHDSSKSYGALCDVLDANNPSEEAAQNYDKKKDTEKYVKMKAVHDEILTLRECVSNGNVSSYDEIEHRLKDKVMEAKALTDKVKVASDSKIKKVSSVSLGFADYLVHHTMMQH
ncbi:MAG: hypothetical protein AB7F64_08485 [Gammaproteobacteria bacterium]